MPVERDAVHPRLAHEETLDLVRAATQALAALVEAGALKTRVEGIVFDPNVDIGDAHLLNIADERVNPATEDGHLAAVAARAEAIAKDHTAAQRTPALLSRVTAINETPVTLAESSTPYVRAWVQASRPRSAYGGSPSASGLPTANAGNVYLSERVGSAWWTLVPGASVELPPCCDLYDFDLCADTGGDGVVILYET